MINTFYDTNYLTPSEVVLQNHILIDESIKLRAHRYQAMKMMAYFRNTRIDILAWLYQYMRKMYSKTSLAGMPFVWYNEVPRIVRNLSLTYKKPATRRIDYVEGKEDSATHKLYHDIQPSLHRDRKDLNQLSKLMNTVLVRPIWDEAKLQLKHQYLTADVCEVDYEDGDPDTVLEVRYQINDKPIGRTKKEVLIVHWTEDDHWFTDTEKNIVQLPDVDSVNDYGRMPYEILRIDPCEDFWGDGLSSLVDGQEANNAKLTDKFFKLHLNYGQPVGTNLNIKAEEFSLGPDRIILNDDVKGTDVPPNLSFATPEHKIGDDAEAITELQNQLSRQLGIPASGVRYSSGYERELDHEELLEINENDTEVYRDFEMRLFKLDKLIMEKDANKNIGETFDIEFAAVEFPKTEAEQISEREFELKHNISTPVDWLMEEKQINDRNKAKEILIRNRDENKEIKGQSVLEGLTEELE